MSDAASVLLSGENASPGLPGASESSCNGLPVSRSHRRSVPLRSNVVPLAVASSLPLGASALASIGADSSRRRVSFPLATSHTRIVRSRLVETTVLLSGEMPTETTGAVCPVSGSRGLPVAKFQRRSVWSSLPEVKVLPSRDNDKHVTAASCPLQVRSRFPVAASHTQIDPSCPETRVSLVVNRRAVQAPMSGLSNRRSSLPVATSHRQIAENLGPTPGSSHLAHEATVFPSGEKTKSERTECMPLVTLKPWTSLPVVRSQMCVLSSGRLHHPNSAVASSFPSGEKSRWPTESYPSPIRGAGSSFPVATSQSVIWFTPSLSPPAASTLPSGEKVTTHVPEGRVNTRSCSPVARSQSRIL